VIGEYLDERYPFFNDPAATEIYTAREPLSLLGALAI
jgi:hypothetical protein